MSASADEIIRDAYERLCGHAYERRAGFEACGASIQLDDGRHVATVERDGRSTVGIGASFGEALSAATIDPNSLRAVA